MSNGYSEESESSGVVNDEKIVSIPYNDLENSLKILKKYSKNLAGCYH